jgi:choline dehydrogenase-like flavoprotein
MTHYDVVIIGTGAGGGTLARHLAPSGKRILLLERGGWLPREPQNISADEVFVSNRYVSATRGGIRTARRISASYATTTACHRRGRSATT